MYCILYQIGITPGGCCVWVSHGQSPRLSDTQQCVLANLLEFLHPGGRLWLDRGYEGMRGAGMEKDIRVTMPLFRHRLAPGQKEEDRIPFAREEALNSMDVAGTRVHNERQMGRTKAFRFLKGVVPFEYKDILDDLVWVRRHCMCLGRSACRLTVYWCELDCCLPREPEGATGGHQRLGGRDG